MPLKAAIEAYIDSPLEPDLIKLYQMLGSPRNPSIMAELDDAYQGNIFSSIIKNPALTRVTAQNLLRLLFTTFYLPREVMLISENYLPTIISLFHNKILTWNDVCELLLLENREDKNFLQIAYDSAENATVSSSFDALKMLRSTADQKKQDLPLEVNRWLIADAIFQTPLNRILIHAIPSFNNTIFSKSLHHNISNFIRDYLRELKIAVVATNLPVAGSHLMEYSLTAKNFSGASPLHLIYSIPQSAERVYSIANAYYAVLEDLDEDIFTPAKRFKYLIQKNADGESPLNLAYKNGWIENFIPHLLRWVAEKKLSADDLLLILAERIENGDNLFQALIRNNQFQILPQLMTLFINSSLKPAHLLEIFNGSTLVSNSPFRILLHSKHVKLLDEYLTAVFSIQPAIDIEEFLLQSSSLLPSPLVMSADYPPFLELIFTKVADAVFCARSKSSDALFADEKLIEKIMQSNDFSLLNIYLEALVKAYAKHDLIERFKLNEILAAFSLSNLATSPEMLFRFFETLNVCVAKGWITPSLKIFNHVTLLQNIAISNTGSLLTFIDQIFITVDQVLSTKNRKKVLAFLQSVLNKLLDNILMEIPTQLEKIAALFGNILDKLKRYPDLRLDFFNQRRYFKTIIQIGDAPVLEKFLPLILESKMLNPDTLDASPIAAELLYHVINSKDKATLSLTDSFFMQILAAKKRKLVSLTHIFEKCRSCLFMPNKNSSFIFLKYLQIAYDDGLISKASLCRILTDFTNGLSPLALAVQNGNTETMDRLLAFIQDNQLSQICLTAERLKEDKINLSELSRSSLQSKACFATLITTMKESFTNEAQIRLLGAVSHPKDAMSRDTLERSLLDSRGTAAPSSLAKPNPERFFDSHEVTQHKLNKLSLSTLPPLKRPVPLPKFSLRHPSKAKNKVEDSLHALIKSKDESRPKKKK